MSKLSWAINLVPNYYTTTTTSTSTSSTCSKGTFPNLNQGLTFRVHVPHQEYEGISLILRFTKKQKKQCEMYLNPHTKKVSLQSPWWPPMKTVTSMFTMSPSSKGLVCDQCHRGFSHVLARVHLRSGIPWHTTLFTEVHTDFGKPL